MANEIDLSKVEIHEELMTIEQRAAYNKAINTLSEMIIKYHNKTGGSLIPQYLKDKKLPKIS